MTTKAVAYTVRQMAPRCSAIPGLMWARRDPGRARAELSRVAALAEEAGGLVPRTEKDFHPDAMANLWFVRAAHEFAQAAAGEKVLMDFFHDALLPVCKRAVQAFVSDGGLDGVRMDDGGLLAGGVSGEAPLRVNALWYVALEATAAAVQGAAGPKDPAGGHFERLAGRFRRAFTKAYWCDAHKRVCSPAARAADDHGALPEADQLLLTALPVSPLPRTKQRQILSQVTTHALGPLGVWVKHPALGMVESPVHRAWLARGTAVDEEARHAAGILVAPLAVLRADARKMAVSPFYRDGQPAGHAKPDALSSAEMLGALARWLGE